METEMYVWLGILVAALIVEGATMGLISIWFALGAFAGMLTAVFGGSEWLQILISLLVTAVALWLTRPFVQKMKLKKVATNADRVVGLIGIATEAVDGFSGAVHVDGKDWSARTLGDEKIEPGIKVKIIRIDGVRLFVEPALENVAAK